MFNKVNYNLHGVDAFANHSDLKDAVKQHGVDPVFEELKAVFTDQELYSMSTYWENSPDYILKARGTRGDVIVGWDHKKYVKELF